MVRRKRLGSGIADLHAFEKRSPEAPELLRSAHPCPNMLGLAVRKRLDSDLPALRIFEKRRAAERLNSVMGQPSPRFPGVAPASGNPSPIASILGMVRRKRLGSGLTDLHAFEKRLPIREAQLRCGAALCPVLEKRPSF